MYEKMGERRKTPTGNGMVRSADIAPTAGGDGTPPLQGNTRKCSVGDDSILSRKKHPVGQGLARAARGAENKEHRTMRFARCSMH